MMENVSESSSEEVVEHANHQQFFVEGGTMGPNNCACSRAHEDCQDDYDDTDEEEEHEEDNAKQGEEVDRKQENKVSPAMEEDHNESTIRVFSCFENGEQQHQEHSCRTITITTTKTKTASDFPCQGNKRNDFVPATLRSLVALCSVVLLLACFIGDFWIPFRHYSSPTTVDHSKQHRKLRKLLDNTKQNNKPLKILYTITSLAEYNTGSRATVKGSDRLQETLIPVVSESVQTMLAFGYHVDVFIVSHYIMRPERLQLIRDALPGQVGLKYWDDAMPMGYDTGVYQEMDGKSQIVERGISLARQHRFVVRDHFLEYDVFCNYEDDMLIKGDLVKHYLDVTNELERLKEAAPEFLPGNPDAHYYGSAYSGPMTKGQLSRMIPGFIRVEALLDPDVLLHDHTKQSPVPVDLHFDENNRDKDHTIDPAPCCHVSEGNSSPKRPGNPKPDRLIFWETDILPLGVRQMPQEENKESFLDWVALLRGPTYDKDSEMNTIVADYWSGSDGYFGTKKRPGGNARNFINNMGGWMATRQQIWEWHTKICPGGFLPPYEAPHFRFDGLDLRDVEWWSGGLHLATKRHACNMHRVVSLKPDHFHFHLLYHTANNKQNQLGLHRFTKANDLLGQLNTVRKNAARKIPRHR